MSSILHIRKNLTFNIFQSLMQAEPVKNNRPYLQTIEKVVIALYILALLLKRIGYPGATLLSLIITLKFIIAGYFIFMPPKEVKGGKIISILNGAILGLLIRFELYYFFSPFLILHKTLILFAAFSLSLAIPLLILYILNWRTPENRPYLFGVIIRNLIPLLLILIPILLPDKTRVLIFQGDDSEDYYKILQDEYISDAYSQLDNGQNELAIKSALASVNCSMVRGDSTGYLYRASLNTLGYCYYTNNKYYRADSVLNKALLLANTDDLDEGAQYYKTLRYLAFNYSAMGYYTKSDSLSLAILAIDGNQGNKAYLQETMAGNAGKQGKFQRADSLYRITLINYLTLNVPDPDRYITTHCNMAANCVDMNKFEQADSLYQVSIELVSNYFSNTENQLSSNIYKSLSDLYFRLAKYEQAKEFCIKSVDIQKKLSGTESNSYLLRLAALTQIKIALSDYSNAESTLLGILEITAKKDGPAIANTGNVCLMLAQLYCDYSDYQAGLNYVRRSLAINQQWFGEHALETAFPLDKMAYVQYCLGTYDDADSLYDYALAIKRYYKGRDNQSYAVSLNGLGLVYTAQGFLGKADTILDYSKEIIEKILGTEHPEYATTLNNKGYLRLRDGRVSEAEVCFKQALLINEKTFGNSHQHIAENLTGLAESEVRQRRYSDALLHYKRAIDIYKKLFFFTHPNIKLLEKEIEKIS